MSSSKITTLINIKVSHLFFQSGKMKGWNIASTISTRKLMRKSGLFFKHKGIETTIGFTHIKTAEFLENHKTALSLDFIITIPNPYFQNFTKIPLFSPVEKYLYFKNWKDANSGNNGSITVGHNPTIISKFTNQFLHQTPSVNAEDLFSKSEDFTKLYPSYSSSNIGIINLKINKELLTGAEEENFQPYQYKIHFEARKTIWRYFFLNNKQGLYENIKISDDTNMKKKEEELHTSKGDYRLSDGNVVKGYSLTKPRALKEYYPDNLKAELVKKVKMQAKIRVNEFATLTRSITANGKTIPERNNNPKIILPNATEQTTRGIKTANGTVQMYSDIYVYM